MLLALTFVGSEAVVFVQILDFANGFLVEFLGIRCFVEVEIPSEDFISAFSAQDHLAPGGLDTPGQEEHGRRGSDGGHVERFQVIHNVMDGVQALFHGEVEAVVSERKDFAWLS